MERFTIYPAIDMRGGKCVRLIQGDYDQETVYGDSPFDMASRFSEQGASWIHMVDLDGAKVGKRVNDSFVLEVASRLSAKVQIGGGIRTVDDVKYYIENGVDRVILGSAAINNPDFVIEMLQTYGGTKIAIGLDAKNGYVATEGWIETSSILATDLAMQLVQHGAETFIFTDIATDGMLSGPNVKAVADLARLTGKSVIASGGVSSLADLRTLKTYEQSGVSGAIVGKAIYTNQFTVKEAIQEVVSC
jgi:phosphoribosylformimino-5-aminoimidazole carboxamide ribotide isomerase